MSEKLPIPSPGDTYVKGPRRYDVVRVSGTAVLLRGAMGTLFEEPLTALALAGYQLHPKNEG